MLLFHLVTTGRESEVPRQDNLGEGWIRGEIVKAMEQTFKVPNNRGYKRGGEEHMF